MTKELQAAACVSDEIDVCAFEREINVKPVPFVNVFVHQEFTVRGDKLARAEYTKLSGGKTK